MTILLSFRQQDASEETRVLTAWEIVADVNPTRLHGGGLVAVGLAVTLFISACGELAGPEYSRPETPEAASWSGMPEGVSADAIIRPEWWHGFGDSFLDQLIDNAIAQNFDLRVIAARSEVARAGISQANAARLPTVDAALSGTYQRSSKANQGFQGKEDRQATYGANLGWEIDIWGKAKKGVKAQEAAFRASEADWRAAYLSLVSDVAATYFRVRLFDEQIKLQQTALDRNRVIMRIYTAQHGEGIVPESRLIQQEAELGQLKVDLLELQRLRQLSENALNTLLGVPPGTLEVGVATLTDTVQAMEVPGGLPSELLEKRPDIIAAQYRILQAFELEGQASLARLPSVSLTSSLGNASTSLSDLFDKWTLGVTPRVSIPIFNPGIQAQYRVSQAQSDLAEEQYRAVVIRAFGEVDDSLTNLFNRRAQQEQLVKRQARLEIVARQVEAQVVEGMVSQLEVFEAERSLLSASQQKLAVHQLILSDTLALYKAMGGGWPTHVVK
jgi:multidrug efflux system outer membrane protein